MYRPDQFAHDVLTTTAHAVEQDLPPAQLEANVAALVAKFLQPGEPVLKFDDEQQMVWGWASVAVEKGQPVHDLQGDVIDIGELQKAAHAFVVNERVSKEQHAGPQIGTVVDSIVFTKEVQHALGINLGREGWYVGVHVEDPRVWARVKKGELAAFSIGGSGEREPVGKAQEHGTDGKFTSGGGGTGKFTVHEEAKVNNPDLGGHATVQRYSAPASTSAYSKTTTPAAHGVRFAGANGTWQGQRYSGDAAGEAKAKAHFARLTGINKALSFSDVIKGYNPNRGEHGHFAAGAGGVSGQHEFARKTGQAFALADKPSEKQLLAHMEGSHPHTVRAALRGFHQQRAIDGSKSSQAYMEKDKARVESERKALVADAKARKADPSAYAANKTGQAKLSDSKAAHMDAFHAHSYARRFHTDQGNDGQAEHHAEQMDVHYNALRRKGVFKSFADVVKEWSDVARAAAAEARRLKAKGDGHGAVAQAQEASAAANGASNLRTQYPGSDKYHQDAIKAHMEASEAHAHAGNQDKAGYHQTIAQQYATQGKPESGTVSARITSPHSGHEYEVQHNGSKAFVRNITAPKTIPAADAKSGFHSALNSTKFGFSEKLTQPALEAKLNALKVKKALSFQDVLKAQEHGPDGKFVSGGGGGHAIGSKVVVHDPENTTGLHGRVGTVTRHHTDGRHAVALSPHDTLTVSPVKLRAAKPSDITRDHMTKYNTEVSEADERLENAKGTYAARRAPGQGVLDKAKASHKAALQSADKGDFATARGHLDKVHAHLDHFYRVAKSVSFNEVIGKAVPKAEQDANDAAQLARESASPIPHAPGSEKQRADAIAAHGKAHTHLTTEQSLSLLAKRTKVPLSSDETAAHLKAHLAAGGKRDQAAVEAEEAAELKTKEKERQSLGLGADED